MAGKPVVTPAAKDETGASATVTIRLGDRTMEQLNQLLVGWDADVELHSRAPTMREVLTYMARRYDVAIEQIAGKAQTPLLSDMRAVVSWFAYRHIGRSYAQIGRALGDRDHSSVLYQVGRATSARVADPAFAVIVDDLLDHFGYGAAA